MPLTINVGLSRKRSANYNSQGASINLTAELDQSLLVRSDDLQAAINELYEQAEYALVRQTQAPDLPRVEQHAMSPGHGTLRNGQAESSDASVVRLSSQSDSDGVPSASSCSRCFSISWMSASRPIV